MKHLIVFAVMIAMITLAACQSKTEQKSDEELIAEQIQLIDSLLSTNAPITTNKYNVGQVSDITLTAMELIYKSDTIPFLRLSSYDRTNRMSGDAFILPREFNEVANNIDSISKKVSEKVPNDQSLTYGTRCGMTISANNSYFGDWGIYISLNKMGNVSDFVTKQELQDLKELMLKSYAESDGYQHLNKLARP